MLLLPSGCMAMLIGHRGASGHEPENTIMSFEKAIDLGVDMIELDVYVCKSGELVVMHDESIDRTSNGTGLVSELTLDELKQFDVGNGQQMSTLKEVCDQINGRVKLDIELKGPQTAHKTVEIIQDCVEQGSWGFDDFLVTSYDRNQIREVKQCAPQIKTGLIFYGIPDDLIDYLSLGYADIAVIDRESLPEWQKQGGHEIDINLVVYTVNNPEDIINLSSKKIRGIVTDYPDRWAVYTLNK